MNPVFPPHTLHDLVYKIIDLTHGDPSGVAWYIPRGSLVIEHELMPGTGGPSTVRIHALVPKTVGGGGIGIGGGGGGVGL